MKEIRAVMRQFEEGCITRKEMYAQIAVIASEEWAKIPDEQEAA